MKWLLGSGLRFCYRPERTSLREKINKSLVTLSSIILGISSSLRFSGNFADLHVLVDGEIGIADGRISGCRGMAGGGGKVPCGTGDRVGVTVAFRSFHRQRIRRDQFVERDTIPV